MPGQHAPRPRKHPVQARSHATVDAIIGAAARILTRAGYDAFTTNRVAEAAGVSVGSLYQYFPNKESLLAELMRRHVEELERAMEAVMPVVADAPLAEIFATVIDANVQAHLVDPVLHRVLSDEVPPLGRLDAGRAFAERITTRVRGLLAARRAEVAITDLDLATYLVVRTTEACIHEALVHRPADLASGAITRELTRMLVGYLTGAPPAAARPRRAARG